MKRVASAVRDWVACGCGGAAVGMVGGAGIDSLAGRLWGGALVEA
jgi:hypothetical protein